MDLPVTSLLQQTQKLIIHYSLIYPQLLIFRVQPPFFCKVVFLRLDDLLLLQVHVRPTFLSGCHPNSLVYSCSPHIATVQTNSTFQHPNTLFCFLKYSQPFKSARNFRHIASTDRVHLRDHCEQRVEVKQLLFLRLHSQV